MNNKPNEVPQVLEGITDLRWTNNTIYNHYQSPIDFMDDILQWENIFPDGKVPKYIKEGKKAFKQVSNNNDTKLYEDVANKVKEALITRGFTTTMLYGTPGFTNINTGCMSKHRALLGRRDCYFKDTTLTDGKLFHDIFINLSYDGSVSNQTVKNNAFALYALTKELAKLIPMRVYAVNHVGTNTPMCYSYCLKQFRQPITPEKFLFFLSESKRTFGFAMGDILNNGYRNIPTTGNPPNTVSIADFDLTTEITNIIETLKKKAPIQFKDIK